MWKAPRRNLEHSKFPSLIFCFLVRFSPSLDHTSNKLSLKQFLPAKAAVAATTTDPKAIRSIWCGLSPSSTTFY